MGDDTARELDEDISKDSLNRDFKCENALFAIHSGKTKAKNKEGGEIY